jgi:hypothetical protein
VIIFSEIAIEEKVHQPLFWDLPHEQLGLKLVGLPLTNSFSYNYCIQ